MRGARGAYWITAVIACLVAVSPAAAFHATVGDRPVDLDTSLSVREVFEENGSTTHDRTLEQLRVRAAVSLASWLRFDSTTVGTNGGPTLKSDRAGVYNLDDVFQDVSPALDFEEAYVDVFLPSVDLRLGKQKVAWGKLDRFQPNDLINPLSYTDPFLQEEDERKIGVPALQASYYMPDWPLLPAESRLTAVWVPQYVPYRFGQARCDVSGSTSHCDTERWFPPAAMPTQTFEIPAGVIPLGNGAFNPALSVPLGFRTQNAPSPAFRLENNEIGLRYSGNVHDVDFALYSYHGFDPQPAFRLTAEALGERVTDPTNPLHVAGLHGLTTLTPVFKQIDSGGADFSSAIGRFTLRGEGAYISGRPFSRDLRVLVTDPQLLAGELAHALGELAGGAGHVAVPLPDSFVTRDAVEWGVGGDVVYEGYFALLQLNQTDVLNNHVNLLIKNVESRLLANLRKSFFGDTLHAQLVAIHAIESDYTLLRPRLVYQVTDHVSAEAGYLFIAGRAESTIGQYRRNDQGWVRFEYQL